MSQRFALFIISLFVGIAGFSFGPVHAMDDFIPVANEAFNPIQPTSVMILAAHDYDPRFQWEEIEAADWYHMVIVKNGQVQFDHWYEASSVCQEGICTTSNDVWATGNGQFTWWMGYWNPSLGADYGSTYESSTFSLSIPLPNAPVSTGSPNGTINDTTPGLTWHNGSGALWYNIVVVPADYSSVAYDGWHNRTDVCSTELDLCGVNVPNPLPFGQYEVWGRSWNTSGTSTWVKLSEFTIGLGITS